MPFTWGTEEDAAFEKLKDSITNDDTLAFFDPGKPITVRTEASFHEGLAISRAVPKDSKGITTCTLHKQFNGHCNTAIQSNRERCFGCEICKITVQYVPTGSAKVQDCHIAQTIDPYIQ